jgi:hypothetical protein
MRAKKIAANTTTARWSATFEMSLNLNIVKLTSYFNLISYIYIVLMLEMSSGGYVLLQFA